MELRLGGVLGLHTDHRGFNVISRDFHSWVCQHRHRSYLRRYSVNIMPFLILSFHKKESVIILTGGSDLGHWDIDTL